MMGTWYGDCFVLRWLPTVMVKKKGQRILVENHLKTEQDLYKNNDNTPSYQTLGPIDSEAMRARGIIVISKIQLVGQKYRE